MSAFMILFLLLASLIQALPLTIRDVYNPPITSPNAQSVWHVGEKQMVTWDTSSLPADLPNIGMVVLGFLANDSENLMLDNPLATQFKLTDGNVQITVPDVPTRNDYIVVVFGDSGNISPEFTIQGSDAPTTTTSITTTTSPSDETPSSPTDTSTTTTTSTNLTTDVVAPTSAAPPQTGVSSISSTVSSASTQAVTSASTSGAERIRDLRSWRPLAVGTTSLLLSWLVVL